MKNTTLSADEELIKAARNAAKAQQTTLNRMFRDWLTGISHQSDRLHQARTEALLDRLVATTNAGRRFTRDEMNER